MVINEDTRFQVITTPCHYFQIWEVMRYGVGPGCEVSIISFHAHFLDHFLSAWIGFSRTSRCERTLCTYALKNMSLCRSMRFGTHLALHIFGLFCTAFLFSNFSTYHRRGTAWVFFINTFRIQVTLLTVEWKNRKKKHPVRIIKNTFLHNCWGANSQGQPICSTNHHRVLNGCSLICHSWAIKHHIFYADIWTLVVNFYRAAAAVYVR